MDESEFPISADECAGDICGRAGGTTAAAGCGVRNGWIAVNEKGERNVCDGGSRGAGGEGEGGVPLFFCCFFVWVWGESVLVDLFSRIGIMPDKLGRLFENVSIIVRSLYHPSEDFQDC